MVEWSIHPYLVKKKLWNTAFIINTSDAINQLFYNPSFRCGYTAVNFCPDSVPFHAYLTTTSRLNVMHTWIEVDIMCIICHSRISLLICFKLQLEIEELCMDYRSLSDKAKVKMVGWKGWSCSQCMHHLPWHCTRGSPQCSCSHSVHCLPPKPGRQWHWPVNWTRYRDTGWQRLTDVNVTQVRYEASVLPSPCCSGPPWRAAGGSRRARSLAPGRSSSGRERTRRSCGPTRCPCRGRPRSACRSDTVRRCRQTAGCRRSRRCSLSKAEKQAEKKTRKFEMNFKGWMFWMQTHTHTMTMFFSF